MAEGVEYDPKDKRKLALELVGTDAYKGYLKPEIEGRMEAIIESMISDSGPLSYDDYLRAHSGYLELGRILKRLHRQVDAARAKREDV